jgi:hypothetical protein
MTRDALISLAPGLRGYRSVSLWASLEGLAAGEQRRCCYCADIARVHTSTMTGL